MYRRIASIVLIVMLALQGIAGAMAEISPPQASDSDVAHHCDGHENAGAECKCCSDSGVLGLSCSAMCSVATAAPVISIAIPRDPQQGLSPFAARWAAGPSYSPLNPPPIS